MPEIQMPKLSDTMTEGTLVAWKKKKGDQVSAGEVLAEIETDKATMEWESPEDGTLTEIYVEEGGKVNVGDKIAFIGAEGEEAPKEEEQEKEKKKKRKSQQPKKNKKRKNSRRKQSSQKRKSRKQKRRRRKRRLHRRQKKRLNLKSRRRKSRRARKRA